ncbi:MAG TPA: HAMP domain-containing sensor histidine kinase [Candidatus Chromulinivoraceae bacterium]|nr:HAMP domain-containing sensor histidine kinase [Candidatus Chromulinivoraceae bacterium]
MTGDEGFLKVKDGSPDSNGDLYFLLTAAHELKAPLALIRQLSLSLETGTISRSERERMFRQITLTSERALRLTTDLSRSSRLEDSLFELEPLNPRQLCEEVAHELTPLYKAKNRQIRVASRYRPILVVANRDLLRRIMLNFGDNALHYAEGTEPVELKISSHESGGKIRMGVRDYGPAVPPDIWQRLQSNLGTNTQTLHARPQASGLGLYVAGQFAAVMHGRIGATRHRDGATFYVDLVASSQLRLL